MNRKDKKYLKKSLSVLSLLSILFIFSFSSVKTYYHQEGDDDLKLQSIPKIDLSKLPDIDYKQIYHDWYNPKIDMLIITPDDQDFIDAITPLMEWKNEKGVRTVILSNFSLYSGQDDAEKIRNMIKDFYDRDNIQWVLLAGDATDDLIPIRYAYNPDVVELSDSEYNGYDDYYKPTDYYYADLSGSWDEDGDGRWGESSSKNAHGIDEIDWTPEVYVGRFPASTARELEIMVNKSIAYEKDLYQGDWMNRMLLAGDVSDYSPAEDETRLTTYIIQNFVQPTMNFTHLCEYTSSYTPPDPKEVLTQETFVHYFDEGYSTVFFAGHGDPYSLLKNSSINSEAYSNINANNSDNHHMSSLVYAFACTTAPIDQNDDNIGEILIKRENSGAIGYVGGLRLTWYMPNDVNLEKLNRGNAKLFWQEFYVNNSHQQGKALYDSKVAYVNSDYFNSPSVSMTLEYERKNVLTYCLLGDPELDVYTNRSVPVANPFVEDVYGGTIASVTIKDMQNNIVPRARVHFSSRDGKFNTFYADVNGNCTFSLPAMKNETYNVTITGHNIIPSYFTFTPLSDDESPVINDLRVSCSQIDQFETFSFQVWANDLISGIESVKLLLSRDHFATFSSYSMKGDSQGNWTEFNLKINKLSPGNYTYAIVARDFANNTKLYYNISSWFNVIEILNTGIEIFIIVFSLIFIGFTGIIFLIGYQRYKIMIN